MEKEFWLWVSTWAVFVTRPSDLGFPDEGYALPELHMHYHMVKTSNGEPVQGRDGNLKLFKDNARELDEASREKRESILQRVAIAKGIMNEKQNERFILWHHLEAERLAIEEHIPCATTVYGKQDDDVKEKYLIGFSNGEFETLATKPEIAGSGCNFQRHCHNAIFLGINYKFNDFIQAIHRIWRFLQAAECHVHVIYTEAEEHILKVLLEKWKRHNEMVEEMRAIIQKYGLNSELQIAELKRSIGVKRKEYKTDLVTLVHNDTVLEHHSIPDNTFHMGLSSWPFSIQYEYSANYNDFGHNLTNEKFFEQMDYLVPHLHRTLMPGRVYAVHAKDRIVFGNFSGLGMPSLYPFSDDVIRCMCKHGFVYTGRITIVTDVVRENNQTYRPGWTEQCKDATKMSVGVPEYILLFRKLPSETSNAYADVPVVKSKDEYTRAHWQIDAHSFWRSSGNRLLEPEELAKYNLKEAMSKMKKESISKEYDYDRHVAIAEALEDAGKLPSSFMAVDPQSYHPDVWADVVRMRTLNTSQGQRQQEQHLCPLPFDIVDRLINRFTNPDELVADCFGGLFTVPYRAVSLGRKGFGVDLNESYYKTGVGYLKELEYKKSVPTLFDLTA
jgi:hypothetical protein